MTDEEVGVVDKWFGKARASYPIVILKGGAFENFLGVKHFPWGAVIGPDGTLSFTGDADGTSSPLSAAMSKADKDPLWPKKLDKAAKLLSAEQLGPAYAEVLALQASGKLTEEEAEATKLFQSYLEGRAANALAKARNDATGGFVYGAVKGLAPFTAPTPTFPVTADVQAFLKELEALPTYAQEMKAGPTFAEAQALEDESKFTEAFEGYKGLVKKFAGAKIADLARLRAQALIDGGKPGMNTSCEECYGAGKACAKHAEKVSL